MSAWAAFLAFGVAAFAVDWDRMPPYASLVLAVVIAAAVLTFGDSERRDRW